MVICSAEQQRNDSNDSNEDQGLRWPIWLKNSPQRAPKWRPPLTTAGQNRYSVLTDNMSVLRFT